MQMSSLELTYWRALQNLEPFGEQAQDIRIGTLAALYANTHLPKDAKPVGALEYWQWHGKAPAAAPILLDDVDAQSDLLSRTLFGA